MVHSPPESHPRFDTASLRGPVVKGLFWRTVEISGTRIIAAFVFVALARILAPEIFGIVAVATAFTALLQMVSDLGFVPAVIQRKDLAAEHLDAAFWASMALGVLLTILGIVSGAALASLMNEPALAWVLPVISLNFILVAPSLIPMAVLLRGFGFRALGKRNLIASIVSGGAAILLATTGYGIWALIGSQLVGTVMATILLWFSSSWRPRFTFSTTHFRDLLPFGRQSIAATILAHVHERADDVIVGRVLGTVAVGFYAIGTTVTGLISTAVTGPLANVAFVALSKIQSEPARFANAVRIFCAARGLIGIPVFAALAALAPLGVPLVIGDRWSSAIPVVQVLALYGIVDTVFMGLIPAILAAGRTDLRLRLAGANAILAIGGFLVAVPFGLVAVAWAQVAASGLVGLAALVFMRATHTMGFRRMATTFGPALAAATPMVVFLVGAQHLFSGNFPWLVLFVLVVVGGGVYCALAWFMAGPVIKEFAEAAFTVLKQPQRPPPPNADIPRPAELPPLL